MISYTPFWNTLKKKQISQYQLINKYKVSAGQLSRMRKNDDISTHTINMLCEILDCRVEDIVVFEKEWFKSSHLNIAWIDKLKSLLFYYAYVQEFPFCILITLITFLITFFKKVLQVAYLQGFFFVSRVQLPPGPLKLNKSNFLYEGII